MSWAANEWKDGLPTRALQKIEELEQQLEKLKREKQQKQCQMDSMEQVCVRRWSNKIGINHYHPCVIIYVDMATLAIQFAASRFWSNFYGVSVWGWQGTQGHTSFKRYKSKMELTLKRRE